MIALATLTQCASCSDSTDLGCSGRAQGAVRTVVWSPRAADAVTVHYFGSAHRVFAFCACCDVQRILAAESDPAAYPTSHRLVRPRMLAPNAMDARGTKESSERPGGARIVAEPQRLR